MTSLRERLENKARRTAVLPVPVGNTREAAAEVARLRQALLLLQKEHADATADGGEAAEGDTERIDVARQRLQEALDRQAATVIGVKLQALPADDWDGMFGDLEPDEDGDVDIELIHAVLLAASATDPELQDEAWWAEQLARPAWSKGDRAAISRTLLELNVFSPVAAGKG